MHIKRIGGGKDKSQFFGKEAQRNARERMRYAKKGKSKQLSEPVVRFKMETENRKG